MQPMCGCSFFIFPKGWYGYVSEIELSHMGKNNGNPDLVCENIRIYHGWDRKIRPEDHCLVSQGRVFPCLFHLGDIMSP